MKYLFIDESGDLGLKGSRYFIMAGLLVSEEKKLNHIIKKMRQNKFKKELSSISEIKGCQAPPQVKLHIIKKINNIEDIKIFISVIDKAKISKQYFIGNKINIYNYVAADIAKQIKINDSIKINIDKYDWRANIQREFNDNFKKNLIKSKIKSFLISHNYSQHIKGLQIVDLIAWSYYQFFEHDNSEYITKIKIKTIISKIENINYNLK